MRSSATKSCGCEAHGPRLQPRVGGEELGEDGAVAGAHGVEEAGDDGAHRRLLVRLRRGLGPGRRGCEGGEQEQDQQRDARHRAVVVRVAFSQSATMAASSLTTVPGARPSVRGAVVFTCQVTASPRSGQ
jgi:hypothetical protein